MVFGKKSLSYLEFFNSHLYPEMENLKAIVVQKWNSSNEIKDLISRFNDAWEGW
jgi:hypothetical protein